MNECMRQALVPGEQAKIGMKHSATRGSYMGYTPKERAKIGRYTAENSPARATRHLAVPETITILKSEYRQKLKAMQHAENTTVMVKSLPKKPH